MKLLIPFRSLLVIAFMGIMSFSGLLQAQDIKSPLDTLMRRKWVARTEIGYNFFIGDGANALKTTPRGLGSIKFNWLIGRRFYHKSLYVAPQIGIAIQEYRFDKNLLLLRNNSLPDGQQLMVVEDIDTTREYRKSKLQLISLRIPLEIGFQTRKVNMAVGAFGDILFFAKHKRKYIQYNPYPGLSNAKGSSASEEITAIQSDHNALTLPFGNIGVYARIAYKGIGVYASYMLMDTFEGRTGIRGVQAGISFSKTIYKMRKQKFFDRLKDLKKI